MLNVNTLPNRKDRKIDFDECSQLKTTIEKNRKKEECYFQNKMLVPKICSMRKEEGATVAASPTFPQRAASFVGPSGSKQRQIQTIGKYS